MLKWAGLHVELMVTDPKQLLIIAQLGVRQAQRIKEFVLDQPETMSVKIDKDTFYT
jgi:hypothetical protein